jgi:mannan endo-1,4-beta-mannosidase
MLYLAKTRRRGTRCAFGLLGVALFVAAGCIARGGDAASPSEGSAASSGELPTPTSVMTASGLRSFAVQGQAEKVKVSIVEVSGQAFAEALQATVLAPSDSEWAVQVQAPTAAAVKKGDALLATFYARVAEEQAAGGGETQFVFELAREPWTKSVSYPVKLTPEWRKIQVPFISSDAYAAGQAQLIFRLGYEPQVIQVAGVQLENFGADVALVRLPNTKALDNELASRVVVAEALPPRAAGELAFNIDTGRVIGPISRYVYGINSQNFGGTGATVRRNGGNRGTVYNWELNASSAGRDYQHVNDDWPCTTMGYQDCSRPAAQFQSFTEENKANAADTVVTVPMLDFVSADKKGSVSEAERAPSPRFLKSLPKKPSPLAATPDLNDGVVYQDEFVHQLVQRFGTAGKGGPKFYSLDNEPALWHETHPRIHPEPASYEEVVRRTEATALAVAAVDPSALLLGGVMFGWSEYQSLNSAKDSGRYNATYGNYVEYFLSSLQALEKKHGRRLVHVLDIHWYPEARGTQRITEEDASHRTIDARLQAPRSFWDESYVERSWITQQSGNPVRLLPWFREMIQRRYAGTKLSMTEYSFGGTKHVSGGLAQADVLGVFGREGVFLANYWGNGPGVGDLPPYIVAAFKLYRNYDGKGGTFGDTAISATVADNEAASVFAALDSKQPKRFTLIVINKQQQNIYDGVFTLAGAVPCSTLRSFVLDGQRPEIVPGPGATIQNGSFRFSLKPLSATLLVCQD